MVKEASLKGDIWQKPKRKRERVSHANTWEIMGFDALSFGRFPVSKKFLLQLFLQDYRCFTMLLVAQQSDQLYLYICIYTGFPRGSDGKESACNVGNLGWIPGLGRSPGGGHGNPLQYSCLENAWQATVRGVTKSWT